ncbi:response regulator transcription factor [Actinopolyspora sp. BKK1]|uniref:response regulator transcription factor n=1 Tax=unclassified Actinopolyspora TaxID=2639451 RepID=UPI00325A486E
MIVLIDRQDDAPAFNFSDRTRKLAGIERIEHPDSREGFLDKAERLRPRIGIVSAERADLDIGRLSEVLTTCNDSAGLIVVTSSAERQTAGFALRNGARGALTPAATEEESTAALLSVKVGHPFVAPELITEMHSVIGTLLCAPDRSSAGCGLTDREREVLKLLALGYSNEGIAGQLCISIATVRSHVLHILRKMRVRNRSQAVATAYGVYAAVPSDSTSPLDAQAV